MWIGSFLGQLHAFVLHVSLQFPPVLDALLSGSQSFFLSLFPCDSGTLWEVNVLRRVSLKFCLDVEFKIKNIRLNYEKLLSQAWWGMSVISKGCGEKIVSARPPLAK